ncbi:MAG TPA: hypothetical protein VFN67_20795 [Polyangiales bacterium]|nr:hypothetical protein [Polyangiales bacterium]
MLALSFAACGGGLVPVYNIRSAPVVTARGPGANPQEVRDAIMRALVARAWQVDREGPDGIVATVVYKGHSATVLIQYNPTAYSISYLDSSPGLKFNGAAIHRRYNEWVERLDKTIRKLLASSDGYAAQVVMPGPVMQPVPPPGQQLPPAAAEPAPATAPAPAPPPAGAPAVAPYAAPPPAGAPAVAPYAAPPPPPPPPPPAAAPRR